MHYCSELDKSNRVIYIKDKDVEKELWIWLIFLIVPR